MYVTYIGLVAEYHCQSPVPIYPVTSCVSSLQLRSHVSSAVIVMKVFNCIIVQGIFCNINVMLNIHAMNFKFIDTCLGLFLVLVSLSIQSVQVIFIPHPGTLYECCFICLLSSQLIGRDTP